MNDERYVGRAQAPDHPAAWVPPAPPPPPPPPSATGAASGRRWNIALVVAAIVGALVAGAGIGVPIGLLTRGGSSAPARTTSPNATSGSTATTQARALYRQAMTAMRGSAGFHYVADSTGPNGKQTIVGDATPSGGRQDITFEASMGREQFTLILVSGVVYFEGNVPALEDQLGVPAAASSLQGKWISVSNQDAPYSVVAPGITVADQVQQTPLVASSTTSITTAGGAATRILGTVPAQQGAPAGTGHLDVADASHLPVSYASTVSASGVTATTAARFSAWGTAVSTAAPTGAVAWSTLGATAPPGGFGSGGGSLTPPSATPQL